MGRCRTSLKYIKHWLRTDAVQEWKQHSEGVIQELQCPRRAGLSLGRSDTQLTTSQKCLVCASHSCSSTKSCQLPQCSEGAQRLSTSAGAMGAAGGTAQQDGAPPRGPATATTAPELRRPAATWKRCYQEIQPCVLLPSQEAQGIFICIYICHAQEHPSALLRNTQAGARNLLPGTVVFLSPHRPSGGHVLHYRIGSNMFFI